MIRADLLADDDIAYPVSFRQARRVPNEGASPRGRFETTSRQKLARSARYRRSPGRAIAGFHRRGSVLP